MTVSANTYITDMRTAVKTTIQADSWLGNTDNIALIDALEPMPDFENNIDVDGYFDDELPAIYLIAGAPVRKSTSIGVDDVTLPVGVIVISQHSDYSAGYIEMEQIISRLTNLFRSQVTSVNDFGIDARCGNVTGGEIQTDQTDQVYRFFTQINVEVITELYL